MQAFIHTYLHCRVLTVSETSNFASCSWFSSKDNSCCGKYASAVLCGFSCFEVFTICLSILVGCHLFYNFSLLMNYYFVFPIPKKKKKKKRIE